MKTIPTQKAIVIDKNVLMQIKGEWDQSFKLVKKAVDSSNGRECKES